MVNVVFECPLSIERVVKIVKIGMALRLKNFRFLDLNLVSGFYDYWRKPDTV